MNKGLPPELYQRNEAEQQSLDLFHEGQAFARSGDVKNALVKIQESMALTGNNNPEKVAYLTATVAYLNGDLDKLKTLVDKAGANTIVLQRLANGLETRGTVDYREDYYK